MYRIERMKFTILKTAIMVNSIAANGVRIFLLIFCFPFMLKIKSAATGVAAPKNANSNCRQTKLKKRKENSLSPPKRNLRFYQIQKWQ